MQLKKVGYDIICLFNNIEFYNGEKFANGGGKIDIKYRATTQKLALLSQERPS